MNYNTAISRKESGGVSLSDEEIEWSYVLEKL